MTNWTPETGFVEAKRRIEYERLAKTGSLDLKGLQMPAIPVEIASLVHLTTLNLESNQIGSEGAAHISKLTALTTLNLKSNQIGDEGAAHISKLTALTMLNLESNRIGSEGAAHISKLTALTTLYLDYNQIGDEGAAHISKLTALTTLYLDSNQIGDEGAAHISKLTALTTLNLNFNQIGSEGAAHISKLTALTVLNLNYDQIGTEGAAHISKLTALTTLDLDSNQIGSEGAAHISKLTALTTLNLKSNQIGDEGAAHISKLTALTTLNLNSNQIGDEGAAHTSKLTALTTLNLNSNQIGDEGAAHISKLTALTTLYLDYNQIGDEGAAHISKLTALTTLNLGSNQIGSEGAAHISKLTALTTLNLGSNQIGDEGAAHISKLTALTALNLNSNQIGDEGAAHISKLTALTTLNLNSNQIGDEGAAHIAKLTALTMLYLDSNQIGSEGAAHISKLAALTMLYLESNQIGSEGAAHISKLTALTMLYLDSNQIGSEGAAHISKLAALTTLNLCSNQIGDEGAAHISKLAALTMLYLDSNQIGSEGAAHISKLTTLTMLNLNYNQIGDKGFSALSDLSNLRVLNTANNSINDLTPLAAFRSLIMLRVWGNDFTEYTVNDFIGATNLRYFFVDSLGDIPSEILSTSEYDECLGKLNSYFIALKRGEPKELSDLKVMILGNGQIGKTQMRRFICGQEYDETITSTHGVDICETSLNANENDDGVDLKIWDFGGQDIYLGTHSLFLKSRAIFPLVWTPRAENNDTHIVDGYESRNFPLSYWVEYIKKFAGKRAPMLLIQSQCDLPEQALTPPVDSSIIDDFVFKPREIAFSAKIGTGGDALRGGIKDAVDYLKRQRGATKIGEGWANVKTEIERRQIEDRKIEQTQFRTNRLMSRDEFARIAKKIGGVEDEQETKVLLSYLHDIGTVFYQPGQFDEQIILDQQWALDAIYSIFHRDNGLYKDIEDNRGRFTQSKLDRWVWKDKFTKTEQASLIGMMSSCDICFVIRKESKLHGEAIYVAPDLLPSRGNLHDDRAESWASEASTNLARFKFDLLPPGLLRNLMARVGNLVGQHAVYWKNGFYFSDGTTGAKARVEAALDNPKKWSGELKIQTKSGRSADLLSQLIDMTEEFCAKAGVEATEVLKPELSSKADLFEQQIDKARSERLSDVAARDAELRGQTRNVVSIRPQLTVSDREECFISYAWGEDSDPNCERNLAFEKVQAKVSELGLAPFFDKEKITNSEAITAFMDRATDKPKSVIILSEKYLQSPFCMFEMTNLYRKSLSNEQRLREATRVVVLPDASISRDEDWLLWQDYWQAQSERYDRLMEGRLPRLIPKKTLANSKYVTDFTAVVGDILAAFADTVHYRGIDGIDDLEF